MNLSLADFTIADPDRPPQPITVDWPAVEEWLGTALPDDFESWDERAFRF